MDLTVTFKLAIALALGLIIGLERGWESRDSPQGLRVAGVRSFGFAGLLGGVSAVLAGKLGEGVLAVALLSLGALAIVSYGLTAKNSEDFGITTELALLITFILGAMSGSGLEGEAVSVAVVTAALLGFKQELHQYLERLDRRELLATLQLLLIAGVVLPLLPDRDLGPWNALNPKAIGFLVALIAGISYVGYFAMKVLGTRAGLLATAVLGAMVSSTAVTVSFARMARQGEGAIPVLGAGISLAAGTMAIRILILVGVVNPALLGALAVPIALLAIVPLVAAGAIVLRQSSTESAASVELRNPIELGSALLYGVVLSVLFVLIRAVESTDFGREGIYALAAISGITDVDAVSLSLAQATQRELPVSVAATGILIAAIVNTLVKAAIATSIGGWRLAKWCATILLAALGSSVLAALLFK
ncbi:MAG TPA: MgtC/SapB family protein [Oscillatoriales cyanobacterium M59_W2019_021]|nr:MAG: MgtC/SapB family protein [Cyanobacteria bacterium J055]HIK30060.1 MgtC/SapB family protein [Oscillatoriales cyanobacterium M4454_W2019_049]HIK50371.1 MgtC/SapB family protein [Oscillatoriales cyanobacterium M59_W2019_021]